jgi:hypothetical protein
MSWMLVYFERLRTFGKVELPALREPLSKAALRARTPNFRPSHVYAERFDAQGADLADEFFLGRFARHEVIEFLRRT